jgi:hypothetical protein
MWDRPTQGVLKRLAERWGELTSALTQLHVGTSVKPNDPWTVLRVAEEQKDPAVIKVELMPVVFNLPERANHFDVNLYVVVEGWLELRRDLFESGGQCVTHRFATHAAYFRRKAEVLEHVYGAHYDFALDELGHPIFHAQMKSFAELGVHVRNHYEIDAESEDRIAGVLKTVRLPSAQMDVFSFLLQLCADHLLFKDSGREEKDGFNALLDKSGFLRGAGYQAERLRSQTAISCYRSFHWYPQK